MLQNIRHIALRNNDFWLSSHVGHLIGQNLIIFHLLFFLQDLLTWRVSAHNFCWNIDDFIEHLRHIIFDSLHVQSILRSNFLILLHLFWDVDQKRVVQIDYFGCTCISCLFPFPLFVLFCNDVAHILRNVFLRIWEMMVKFFIGAFGVIGNSEDVVDCFIRFDVGRVAWKPKL